MAKFPDGAIRQILFDKLVEMGRLPSNPTAQTIQTINEIPEPDVLKLLKSSGSLLLFSAVFKGNSI